MFPVTPAQDLDISSHPCTHCLDLCSTQLPISTVLGFLVHGICPLSKAFSGAQSAEGQSHTQVHISRSYIIWPCPPISQPSPTCHSSMPAPRLAALKHTMGTAGPLLSKASFPWCLSPQLQLFLVSFRSLLKYHLLGT